MSTVITKNTRFASYIIELIKERMIRRVLETGTHKGTGSTQIFLEAFRRARINDYELVTLECNPKLAEEARRNLAGTKVQVMNCLSVPRYLLPSPQALKDEWEMAKKNGIDVTPGQPGDFYRETNFDVPDRGLLRALNIFSETPELIFLDSCGGLGFIEFTTLMIYLQESCIMAFDDSSHIKHYKTLRYIRGNSDFQILREDPDERFGWFVADYKGAGRCIS